MHGNSLLKFLKDGDWHPEKALQAQLGLSEEELQQVSAELQEMGLNLQINPELGYRIPYPLRLLDLEQILLALPSSLRSSLKSCNLNFVVESTNSQAMEWLRSGANGRALFLAESQSGGRGRRGRAWVSPVAHNIILSLVWPVANKHRALEGLSLVVALSLVESLRAAGLVGMEELGVKWPNDVLLGNAKLAGILLELHTNQQQQTHVVIGVGVNVRMPPEALEAIDRPVADLHSRGNEVVDRNKLIANLLVSLERNLLGLQERGFEEFRQQWPVLDVYTGKRVEITGHGEPIEGVASGVSSTGALILETDEGRRFIAGGEVAPSVRPL